MNKPRYTAVAQAVAQSVCLPSFNEETGIVDFDYYGFKFFEFVSDIDKLHEPQKQEGPK